MNKQSMSVVFISSLLPLSGYFVVWGEKFYMATSFNKDFHKSATGYIKEHFCLFLLGVAPTSFPIVLVHD